MDSHPLVQVVDDLPHQWEIHVNPDGTRSFYARRDLVMTEAVAELIDDLIHARHDHCPVCNEIVWAALGLKVGTSKADVLTRLIREATQEGRHLTITSDGAVWHNLAAGHDPACSDAPYSALRACMPQSRREQQRTLQRWI